MILLQNLDPAPLFEGVTVTHGMRYKLQMAAGKSFSDQAVHSNHPNQAQLHYLSFAECRLPLHLASLVLRSEVY